MLFWWVLVDCFGGCWLLHAGCCCRLGTLAWQQPQLTAHSTPFCETVIIPSSLSFFLSSFLSSFPFFRVSTCLTPPASASHEPRPSPWTPRPACCCGWRQRPLVTRVGDWLVDDYWDWGW